MLATTDLCEKEGHGSCTFITGTLGMGKTRIIQEVVLTAQQVTEKAVLNPENPANAYLCQTQTPSFFVAANSLSPNVPFSLWKKMFSILEKARKQPKASDNATENASDLFAQAEPKGGLQLGERRLIDFKSTVSRRTGRTCS